MFCKTVTIFKHITCILGLFCSFSTGLFIVLKLKFSEYVNLSNGEVLLYIMTALIITSHILLKMIDNRNKSKNQTSYKSDILKVSIYSIVGIIVILLFVLSIGIFIMISGSFEMIPDEEDIEKMVIGGYTIAYASAFIIYKLINKICDLSRKLRIQNRD